MSERSWVVFDVRLEFYWAQDVVGFGRDGSFGVKPSVSIVLASRECVCNLEPCGGCEVVEEPAV